MNSRLKAQLSFLKALGVDPTVNSVPKVKLSSEEKWKKREEFLEFANKYDATSTFHFDPTKSLTKDEKVLISFSVPKEDYDFLLGIFVFRGVIQHLGSNMIHNFIELLRYECNFKSDNESESDIYFRTHKAFRSFVRSFVERASDSRTSGTSVP